MMTLFQDPSINWRTLALEWRGGWATTWPGLEWRQLELRGWKKSARPPLGQGDNTAADYKRGKSKGSLRGTKF